MRTLTQRNWFLLALMVLSTWQLYHVGNSPQFMQPPLFLGDGPDYEAIAYNIHRGNGFRFAWSDPEWRMPYESATNADDYSQLTRIDWPGPTTARPPLLPTVIAGVYCLVPRGPSAFAAVRVLSALAIGLAGALAVSIAFSTTERMAMGFALPHVAAAITLAIAFLDKTIRTYAIDFLSEPLSLLLLTLTVFLALVWQHSQERNRLLAIVGVLMGLLVLARSIHVFWIPGLVILVGISTGQWKSSKPWVFATVLLAVIGPWSVRNCLVLQRFMPMGAQGAASIRGGYSDQALADGGNWHADAEIKMNEKLDARKPPTDWTRPEREVALADLGTAETMRWVRQSWSELPRLLWLRLQTHWGPYFGTSLMWRVGMIIGAVALMYHRRPEAIWFLGVPAISSLTVMLLYETGGRFLVPLYGLLYALAGIGMAWLFSWVWNDLPKGS